MPLEETLGVARRRCQLIATTVAAVAVSWLAAQPTVASSIISARTVEQLSELLPGVQLRLSDDELRRLTDAGAPTAMSNSDMQPVD